MTDNSVNRLYWCGSFKRSILANRFVQMSLTSLCSSSRGAKNFWGGKRHILREIYLEHAVAKDKRFCWRVAVLNCLLEIDSYSVHWSRLWIKLKTAPSFGRDIKCTLSHVFLYYHLYLKPVNCMLIIMNFHSQFKTIHFF